MVTILAELATNHGGDVGLAVEMIHAAAEAGATYAKLQSFSLESLNPRDPQAEWLRQSHLNRAAHERLIQVGKDAGIPVISTPFDAASLQMLRDLGLTTFKIASSESGNDWWQPRSGETWFVSWPWGKGVGKPWVNTSITRRDLTAIPLYPTPLECVGRATLLSGWSDHTVSLAACQSAIANGVTVVEAHLGLDGRGRVSPWDKTPGEFRELREFANAVDTMRSGVGQRFRERWQHR